MPDLSPRRKRIFPFDCSTPSVHQGSVAERVASVAVAKKLGHNALGESVVRLHGKLAVLNSWPNDAIEAKSRVVDALQQTNADVSDKDVSSRGVGLGSNQHSNLKVKVSLVT